MEVISLPLAVTVMTTFGFPGLFFLVWWFDHKKMVRDEAERQRQFSEFQRLQARQFSEFKDAQNALIAQYREDVVGMKRLYENNVYLVDNYKALMDRMDKLLEDVLSALSLNTQTLTHLDSSVQHNDFCPVARKDGGR
jgi:hypothetical protein